MSVRKRLAIVEAAQQPAWLGLLDHTADIGIVVQAGTLAELFSRAAWGMFFILADIESVRPAQCQHLAVEAPDREALMVRWLAELNFRHVTRHELYCQFNVQGWNDQQLTAEVAGERVDTARHTLYTEIKAVTFHGLRIEQAGAGWQAQIIFDL